MRRSLILLQPCGVIAPVSQGSEMASSALQHSHAMAIPDRRPAYGVNAPALFRHTGFRIEDPHKNPLTATDDPDANRRRETFVSDLNRALAKIQRICGVSQPVAFLTEDDEQTENTIPITNTLLTSFGTLPSALSGWRARLLIDIHSEYYFLTFILDQPSTRETVSEIAEIEHNLSTEGCAAVDIKAFIDRFYDDVWEILGGHLEGSLDELPGQRFTEFRAIALRDTEGPFVKNRHEHHDRFTIPEIGSSDFAAARQSLRAWLTRNAQCIHAILQFDAFTKKVDQDANCILCEVLDGAGVYGSSVRQALSGQSGIEAGGDAAAAHGAIQPLRYFLLYNGLSKYQLGRLVRRTHIMGELRVAAVLDGPLLRRASSRIRSLGNRIDTLLTDKDEAATLADDELDSVLQELNRINSLVPGGLMYRVNRSRYYVNAFRERMADMR